MDKKHVLLIKSNLMDLDPRLEKVKEMLQQGGYSVTILSWDRERKTTKNDYADKVQREIIFKLKSPFGIRVLPLIPLWWLFEFYWLVKEEPDLIHAVNFDSIIPAIIMAKLKKLPLIYEIADVYADHNILPGLVRSMGILVERNLLRYANGVIIANEGHIAELNGIPNSKVVGIYNSPPDLYKSKMPKLEDDFILFFAGVLSKSRHMNLSKVIKAVNDLSGVKVLIAGFGDCADEIAKSTEAFPGKVEFLGKISYDRVLELTTRKADLLFALYDPIVPVIKYSGANKLFEAMMSGKPILVSAGTIMAEIVKRENCGIVVDCNDINEIRNAIILLKENHELWGELGMNGRRAYEEKYNHEIMKRNMISFYHDVFSSFNEGAPKE